MPIILQISRKVRIKKTPIALFYPLILAKPQDLRHTCEQDQGMSGYGWTAYDVRKGGMLIVNDTGNKLDLINLFAKVSDDERSGKRGLRVRGIPRANSRDHQKTTDILPWK